MKRKVICGILCVISAMQLAGCGNKGKADCENVVNEFEYACNELDIVYEQHVGVPVFVFEFKYVSFSEQFYEFVDKIFAFYIQYVCFRVIFGNFDFADRMHFAVE